MSEHTPGPWHVHVDSGHILNDAGEQVLWTEAKGVLSGDKGIAAKAEDWRVIIAAPDCLAMCEKLCAAIKLKGTSVCASYAMAVGDPEMLTEEYVIDNWLDHIAVCLAEAYRDGCAAIAKAKG